MAEFLRSPTATIVILLAVTASLIAAGAYVILRVRASMREDAGPSANALITHFREIHSRGGMSDDEFRSVKAKLGAQLKDEVKVNENKKL